MMTSTEEQQVYHVGSQLPNGATVVRRHGDSETGYVYLANFRGEFVTWAAPSHDAGATCWGHYFGTNFNAAREDFRDRVRRGY